MYQNWRGEPLVRDHNGRLVPAAPPKPKASKTAKKKPRATSPGDSHVSEETIDVGLGPRR
jgi:hypothetical protein